MVTTSWSAMHSSTTEIAPIMHIMLSKAIDPPCAATLVAAVERRNDGTGRLAASRLRGARYATRRTPMRLPNSEYTSRPWRIHEIARDFRLEDVWAIRAPGQPGDFQQLVAGFAEFDPETDSSSRIVRGLFALRWKLGRWLGWDRDQRGIGERVDSLSARLPGELSARPGPAIRGTPFRSLYQLDNEFAGEIANQTMQGVIHLGWVPERGHAQMT